MNACRSFENTVLPVQTCLLSITFAAASSSHYCVAAGNLINVLMEALIDAASSEGYFTTSIVKQFKWVTTKLRDKTPMTSKHLTSFTHGRCLVTLGCKNCQYTNVKLSIFTNCIVLQISTYTIVASQSKTAAKNRKIVTFIAR